ncbi:MAG: protein tyrosine phosphatase [Acidobacteria bacterium]|jgi:protein tyrosine/serine phosphatase|nr:protein tyrosine phosphatase [Acidobacteriota bacterium]
MPIQSRFAAALLLAAYFGGACSPVRESNTELKKPRPAAWAQPVALEGVPNLHRVSEALYRSAQPTPEGMKRLAKLGIKTVVNLRAFNSDEDDLRGTKLIGEAISMTAWRPRDEEIIRFLRIVQDGARAPVLVHCQHGADRTGTMVALYRIVVQGWTKDAALEEMVEGGYGFHGVWSNLVHYVSRLDIAGIKRQLNAGQGK